MAFVLHFSVSRGLAHELFYVMHWLWVVGTARTITAISQTEKGFVIWTGSHRWWAPEPNLYLGPYASSSPCCLTIRWYLHAFESRCPLPWICDMLLPGNFQSNHCNYQLTYHHHQPQGNSERVPKGSGLISRKFQTSGTCLVSLSGKPWIRKLLSALCLPLSISDKDTESQRS